MQIGIAFFKLEGSFTAKAQRTLRNSLIPPRHSGACRNPVYHRGLSLFLDSGMRRNDGEWLTNYPKGVFFLSFKIYSYFAFFAPLR